MFARGDKVQIRGDERAYYVTKISGDKVTLRAVRGSQWNRWQDATVDQLQPFSDAAKRAREAAKARDARTCQICGRSIHAAKGLIAHHGYQRPGDGWQTRSCDGARYLPFEVNRDRLGWYLTDVLPPHILEAEWAVAAYQVAGVKVAGPSEYQLDANGKPLVDPRTLGNVYHNPPIGPDHERYAHYLGIAQANAANNLRDLEQHRADQQARFDGWKPAGAV